MASVQRLLKHPDRCRVYSVEATLTPAAGETIGTIARASKKHFARAADISDQDFLRTQRATPVEPVTAGGGPQRTLLGILYLNCNVFRFGVNATWTERHSGDCAFRSSGIQNDFQPSFL